nr:unnamed protein product [Spirometra erinaceieuropaei]
MRAETFRSTLTTSLSLTPEAKPDRYSPREVRHLDYISQFTADIRYVRGSDNVIADALSRPDINTLTSDFDLARLAELQTADESIADLPTLTTDRGSQFQSSLFREFTRLLGCAHITTTAYYPASNGLVERLHRQLKSALMSKTESATGSVNLPLVLLGIRSSVKEDIQCTAAELVYGTPLRLPGEFVQPSTTNNNITSTFVQQLNQRMAPLRPTSTRLTSKHVFVHEDLRSAPFVFVRHDAMRKPLCSPYDGPYKVVQRNDKFYVLQKADKTDTVSIDRLEPAHLECLPSTSAPSIAPTTSSPETPTPLTYPPSPHLTILPTQPDPPPTPPPISSRSEKTMAAVSNATSELAAEELSFTSETAAKVLSAEAEVKLKKQQFDGQAARVSAVIKQLDNAYPQIESAIIELVDLLALEHQRSANIMTELSTRLKVGKAATKTT